MKKTLGNFTKLDFSHHWLNNVYYFTDLPTNNKWAFRVGTHQ